MKFKCVHSGHCCTNKAVQASITLGDVKRLMQQARKSAAQLVGDGSIGLIAAGDPTTNIFDVELGLHYPCKFRKDERCSIYYGRPLNCRMFPISILTEIPFEQVKDFLDEGFACRNHVTYDEENLKIMKNYKDKLGKQILEESAETEKFMQEHDLHQSIDISKHAGFNELHLDDISEKEQAVAKISFCEGLIGDEQKSKLIIALQSVLSHQYSVESDHIPVLKQL